MWLYLIIERDLPIRFLFEDRISEHRVLRKSELSGELDDPMWTFYVFHVYGELTPHKLTAEIYDVIECFI